MCDPNFVDAIAITLWMYKKAPNLNIVHLALGVDAQLYRPKQQSSPVHFEFEASSIKLSVSAAVQRYLHTHLLQRYRRIPSQRLSSQRIPSQRLSSQRIPPQWSGLS